MYYCKECKKPVSVTVEGDNVILKKDCICASEIIAEARMHAVGVASMESK